MILKMFLQEQLIDTIVISPGAANFPAYITYLKYELWERNDELLSTACEEPRFVIDTFPSRMNYTNKGIDELINSIIYNKKYRE